MLRGLLGAAGLAAAAPAVAACGGGSGSAAAGTDTKLVTFGSNGSDPVPKRAYAATLRAFTQSSGDQVKIDTVDHDTFQNTISQYLQGTPDDVFTWFAGYRMQFFAAKGLAAGRRRVRRLSRRDVVVLALTVGIPTPAHLVFVWVPTLASIVLSVTDRNGIGLDSIKFVGVENYQQLFANYPAFWPALAHNFEWLAFFLLVPTPFGTNRPGHYIDWLGDPHLNLWAVLVAASWRHAAYIMVLYLAGLKGLDPALPEAAAIDGASEWQAFVRVVFPR